MSRKLLLADDSITIQKVIGITFVNEDLELSVVGNGDAALEQVHAERPDLILADVFMPGKNGYELCAAVKSDPALCNIPVLLLTGTFEPFDEKKAAQSGADGWIAKPFESQTLINRVHELLDQAAANAPIVVPSIQAEQAIITDKSSTISQTEGGMAAAAVVAFSAPPHGEIDALKEVDFGDILDMEEDLQEVSADGEAALIRNFPTSEVTGEEIAADDLPAASEVEETTVFEPSELVGEDAFALTDEPLPDFDAPEPISSENEEASFFVEESRVDETETTASINEGLSELADEPLMAVADDIDFSDDDGLMELSEDDLLLLDEADAFVEEAPLIETAGKSEGGVSLLETVDVDAVAETETADTTLVNDDFFGGIVTAPEAETGLAVSDTIAAEPEAPVFETDSLSAEAEIADFEPETVLTEPETSTIGSEPEDFSADESGSAADSFSSEPATETTEAGGPDAFERREETASEFESMFAAVESVSPALGTEYAADSGGNDRMGTLSDEDIAVIVEKVAGAVVERLAGSILEKIAWEVVPDLAESLIRQEIHQIREGIRQTV